MCSKEYLLLIVLYVHVRISHLQCLPSLEVILGYGNDESLYITIQEDFGIPIHHFIPSGQ